MADLMPQKKKTLAEKKALLDKVAEKMNKKFGKTVIGRIGATPEIAERLKVKYIPTACPDLNKAISGSTDGGFPRRRCTIVAGMPDSGKTSLVLESAGKMMAEDPDSVLLWMESENSLDQDYMCNTFGIDPERLVFIPVDSSITAEDALDMLHATLGTGSVDMCCINSLKALVPTQEMEADLSNQVVAVQARMNARITKKFNAIVAEHETAFIIITHLTTAIGGMLMKDPMIIAGGHSIQYWSSLTLDMRKRSIGPNDPISKEDGVKIGVTIKKNHVCPTKFPYCKLDYYAIFGQGIELILTALNQAIEKGICQIKGAWIKQYDSEGNEVNKWNGQQKFREYMIANPEEFKKLSEEVYGGIRLNDEEIEDIKDEENAIAATIDPELKEALSNVDNKEVG